MTGIVSESERCPGRGKGSEMMGQTFRLNQKGRIEPIPFLEVQVFDRNDK